jgi:hypothetical protein
MEEPMSATRLVNVAATRPRKRWPRRLLLGSLGLWLVQCDYTSSDDHVLTSLRMTLQSPSSSGLGSPTAPQQVDKLLFDVEALNEKGEVMAATTTLDTFIAAGGSRLTLANPCASTQPTASDPVWLLQRIPLTAGRAQGISVDLTAPGIFGRVEVNLEDPVSQALGSSPSIYFPNPTISRLMRPLDPNAANASYCTPLLGRQVVVDGTSAGGKLVVSSLFQNGLAVSDSSAPDYGSIYVFTFSQPSSYLRIGSVISRLSGAIAKFNGMTQIANPVITAAGELRAELVPQPVVLDSTRLPDNRAANPVNNKWLTKYIAAPATITGIVCEVQNDPSRRDNWLKYNTVIVNLVDSDPASVAGCSPGMNFGFSYFSVQVPGKGFADFDPLVMAGREATFVGMLQNGVSTSGKTLFWTVAVRNTGDVCLLPKAQCPK